MNEDISAVKTIFTNKLIKPWNYKNNDNYNALQTACFTNFYSITKTIIDEMKLRVDKSELSKWINSKTDLGFTALHYASYKGNIDIIKILIENEANIHETNNKGLNVMHMAAQGDQPKSLIYFKEKFNLSFEISDSLGSTPLHWASYTGSYLAFQFLLSFEEIDLNKIDNEGLTPLHLCVMSEKVKIVKSLLQSGANRDIKNKKSKTPLELAQSKRGINNTILEMLEEERTSCHMFVLKIPVQKLDKNNFNIYFFISAHIILESLVFFILLPCNYNCYLHLNYNLVYRSGLLSVIYLLLLVLVITLFFVLLNSNSGLIENKNKDTLLVIIIYDESFNSILYP